MRYRGTIVTVSEKLSFAWRILRGVARRVHAADLSLVAAGTAFFAMLSLFPGLAAVIALVGLITDPALADAQLANLAQVVPDDVFETIKPQISRLAATNQSALGWATGVSLVTALWSSRLGTDALLRALNAVHDAPVRGGFRRVMVALLLTLAMVVVVAVALVTMVLVPVMLTLLPTGAVPGLTVQIVRWAIALAVVFGGIWLLYRFGPNAQTARVSLLSPGAVMSVLVWGVASWGMSFYLTNIAAYDRVYGSIGAVIALLLFLYITIFIVLLGAALNAELKTAEGSRTDTTAPRDASDSQPQGIPEPE